VRLTVDHNCGNAGECDRIDRAGGFVFRNRVVGVLAITRSIGDQILKPFVLAHPHICHATTRLHDRTGSSASAGAPAPAAASHPPSAANNGIDKENRAAVPAGTGKAAAEHGSAVPTVSGSTTGDFLIVGCDGLWDVIDDQSAADFVADALRGGREPSGVASLLVQEALRRGTADNVSVAVVFL
jgi:serine/threonine protein phosphatase PrpC